MGDVDHGGGGGQDVGTWEALCNLLLDFALNPKLPFKKKKKSLLKNNPFLSSNLESRAS